MRLVPVRADGGTELEDKIGKVGEKIDSRRQVQKLLNALLVVGITWIGAQIAFDGLGPIFSLVSGIPIVLGLLFLLYKEGVDL
jgi:ABC-type Na+ efflux pump permease subunit